MAYAGSQFHCGPGWLDNPLAATTNQGIYIPSGFRPDVETWAELSAIVTAGSALPVILEWWDSGADLMRTVVLLAGTDATDTASGIQRPADYNASTNAVVWYEKA